MNKSIIITLVSLLIFSATISADSQLKFATPIELVDSSQKPSDPEMAWNGSRFAIVYAEQLSWNSSLNKYDPNGVYLMFVGLNGNIIKGPNKISTDTYAVYPKIVWTGSEFFILYASGSDTDYLRYYLERYSSSGVKISRHELPGTCIYYNARYVKLVWMANRNEFGIFYCARPPGETYARQLFCKADSSGNPGEILQIYYSTMYYQDIYWDGNRFFFFGGGIFSSWMPMGVAQLLILDANGETLGNGMGFVPVRYCNGVMLLPLKKKGTYLLIYSGYCESTAPAPAATESRDDYFGGQVKVKKNKVSKVNLKNFTGSLEGGWTYPNGIVIGNKYYIAGGHGCGIVFVKVSDKGKIVGEPLFYDPPDSA